MWQSSKAYPMAYCPPGTRALVVLIFTTDWTDLTDWTDWTDLRCVVTVLL